MLGDEQYKDLADKAARYFLDHFIDKEYGGVFWDLKADGTIANAQKQSYVNACGIYGLSEHFRATGNIESLQGAISIYQAMIKHAYDPVNDGFIENFERDWKLPANLQFPKTMKNNLHVLEGLTNLYRVWHDPELRNHLRKQIDVMSNKILDQNTWHERLYLTMDWNARMRIDSYGHDIEFSWLLVEAAEVLGDENIIADTKRIAVNISDIQLKEGTAPEGYIKGEKFYGDRPGFGGQRNSQNAVRLEHVEWWPQAEAVVGYVNAWQISGDKKFLDAAVKAWDWIKKYVIDYEYGEWYGNIHVDGTPVKTSQKASMWRCPYHNSRMGFEIMSRIQHKH
jgi:mannobiose 2-epimerase